jgi:hypothetical protein
VETTSTNFEGKDHMNGSENILNELRGGDRITATDRNGHTIPCRVEVTAPHLGVLWVWDLQNHQRTLMPAKDFHISKNLAP